MGFHHEQKDFKKLPNWSVQLSKSFSILFPSILCQTHRDLSVNPGDEPSVSPGDLELPRYFAEPRPARAIGESDAWSTGKISESKKRREMRAPRPCQVFWIYMYIIVYIYIYNIYIYVYIYIYQQITKKTQMHQSYIHIHIYICQYID